MVGALVISIGAHWMALQSVAWVGMAVRFAQYEPLTEALNKTFDGQHPCALCKVVAEGRQNEKKHDNLKVETKIDLMALSLETAIEPPPPFILYPRGPAFASARATAPPLPPPRAA